MFSTLFDNFRAAPIFQPLLGGSEWSLEAASGQNSWTHPYMNLIQYWAGVGVLGGTVPRRPAQAQEKHRSPKAARGNRTKSLRKDYPPLRGTLQTSERFTGNEDPSHKGNFSEILSPTLSEEDFLSEALGPVTSQHFAS